MTNERVVASATLRSRSGLSVFRDIDQFTFSRLDEFRPRPSEADRVADRLAEAGFAIEARTEVGISFSGPRDLFESEFSVSVRRRELELQVPGPGPRTLSFFEASEPVLTSPRIEPLVDVVQLAIPGIPFVDALPPSPPYYYLDVLTGVPARLNVTPLHAAGITGAGVRVSMVDTGFVIRIRESHLSDSATAVTVSYRARHVQGVWLANDPGHTGTNFFTGGTFDGTAVHLGTPLPADHTEVEVVYSCLHPHYLAQGYHVDDVRAVGRLDVNVDECGHGTAEAANVLAVAPGATFSFVKYSDGGYNSFPLAGFQAAVAQQSPDVITCSWGTASTDYALHLEVANAVANGIVIVFAAGNGHTDNPASWSAKTIAHPRLLSAGGAYPVQGGGLRASNYASSYDSHVYTAPQRHAPDLVGLVGEKPAGILIMLPTQPGDAMDRDLACTGTSAFPNCDETAPDDGWCVCSGTSAAAPQTAGTVALLLERHPDLTPDAVKNVLENSAQDVLIGTSNSIGPDSAEPGWDPATGYGLLDGFAALSFLQPGAFNAYVRDSVEDNGTEPVGAERLYASPDVIVRQSPVADPQDELGLTVKHRYDLSDDVELGQDNYVYLRVQNRGALAGSCTADLYATDPGMFADPSQWTHVGQIAVDDLQPGEFRVAGPLTWENAQIPGAGHYCLIAILDSAADPAPDLGAIHTIDDFVAMVRDRNNVAWKSVNVQDLVPGSSSSFSVYLQGPAGSGHRGDVEIDASALPPGARVVVRLPKRLADTAALTNLTFDRVNLIYTYLVHAGGLAALRNMRLNSNERTQVVVYYTLPADAPHGDYAIAARLYVDSQQTGAYTEVVRVTSFTFIGNRRSRELHRVGCPWERRMTPENRVPFADLRRPHALGYDDCAHCLGA